MMIHNNIEVIIASIFLGWGAGIATFLIGWLLGTSTKYFELDLIKKRAALADVKEPRPKKEKPVEPEQPVVLPVKKTQTSLFPEK